MTQPDVRTRLAQTVEHLFAPEYLFDPVRRAWRELVCPVDAPEPVFFDCAMLLSFADVVLLLSSPSAVGEVAEALAHSSVVEVRRDAAAAGMGGWQIRRRAPLLEADNPEKRTVFVKPVHFDAKDADIVTFFGQFGAVARVERRCIVDAAADSGKARPSVFVVFATRDAAVACVAAKPQYPTTGNPLADLFIPRLTVMMKSTYEVEAAEQQEAEYLRNQRKVLAEAAAGRGPATACGGDDDTHRFIKKGVVCKVSGLPTGVTWQQLKAKLGNLALHDPMLKGGITLVRVESPTGSDDPKKPHSGSNRVAYVVCRTPAIATALVMAYNVQRGTNEFAKELAQVAPNLTLLAGDEEAKVRTAYATWSADKAQHRQSQNQQQQQQKPKAAGGSRKRPREEDDEKNA